MRNERPEISQDSEIYHSGYVSIIGRPNVGKSTLLNSILGEKIAIVTPKPQTTRNRVIGIKTLPQAQIIFIDTPGIHRPRHRLGEAMVKTAKEALKSVDIILFMVEAGMLENGDMSIIYSLKNVKAPVFLLINKIDLTKKRELLPFIEKCNGVFAFKEIIPISALKNDGIDILVEKICNYLPKGPKYYPGDLITVQMEKFIVSEIIREKIMKMTEQELPHSVAVVVTEWKEREDGLTVIKSNIYVERGSQKAIIIGKQGYMLKSIGTAARKSIESFLNTHVFLELWVKVKKGWRNNTQFLRELGYI